MPQQERVIPLNGTTASSVVDLPDSQWLRNGFGMSVEKSKNNGKWTEEECALLEQSVEQYCSMRGIAASYLCSSDSKTSDEDHSRRRGAWIEISKALPHRSVQSIYRKSMRHLGPHRRGEWSKDEVNLLQNLVQHHGKKWATIASVLKRSSESCRDKYREFPLRSPYVKGWWLPEDVERLLLVVRDVLRVPPSYPLPSSPPTNAQDLLHPKDKQRNDTVNIASNVEIKQEEQQQYAQENLPYRVTPEQRQYFLSFVKAIDQYCNQQEKHRCISWDIVSKRMENRSRLACFTKWQRILMGTMTDPDDEENNEEEEERGSDDVLMEQDKSKGKRKRKVKATSKEINASVAASKQSKKRRENNSLETEQEEQTSVKTEATESLEMDRCFKLHNPEDIQLLQQIAAMEASRPTDIDWATGLTHPRAFARFQELLDEVERENDSDELLDLPLSSQADALLRRSECRSI
jgi:hypothetical protein